MIPKNISADGTTMQRSSAARRAENRRPLVSEGTPPRQHDTRQLADEGASVIDPPTYRAETSPAPALAPTAAAGPSRGSDATVQAGYAVLRGQSRRHPLARLLPFLGPAFIACVAYIDPGNFATNIQGGAQFGYLLAWVIVASNLMAMMIQALSAKLGIATGLNLAEVCRARFPRWLVWGMWVLAELIAMATDLAEFLGAALGFRLLLHLPLLLAGLLTAGATFLILGLQRRGFRPLEAMITAMVGMVALSYVLETVLDQPDWGQVAYHSVVPQLEGRESLLLAVGILGATVMPHVIFLHSSLTQHRIRAQGANERRRLFRFELADVIIAMTLAGLVNLLMLVLAAATFYTHGLTGVASVDEAYRTLQPLLGNAASTIFALSLIASGLSSSTVGTMAGQVVMQGFLHRQIPLWLRRLVTMLPALVLIALNLDPTTSLVVSQVVLSFGIPFALIPLILFTRRREVMGDLVNHRLTTLLAWAVASLIVALNIALLAQVFQDFLGR
jgi:manganese transport protein